MAEIYHHRGCRIAITRTVSADGAAIVRYEITAESEDALAAFKRHGVDQITGSKITDLGVGAGREEIDLLLGGPAV
jgi:hypothetical protein